MVKILYISQVSDPYCLIKNTNKVKDIERRTSKLFVVVVVVVISNPRRRMIVVCHVASNLPL